MFQVSGYCDFFIFLEYALYNTQIVLLREILPQAIFGSVIDPCTRVGTRLHAYTRVAEIWYRYLLLCTCIQLWGVYNTIPGTRGYSGTRAYSVYVAARSTPLLSLASSIAPRASRRGNRNAEAGVIAAVFAGVRPEGSTAATAPSPRQQPVTTVSRLFQRRGAVQRQCP